MKILLNLIMIFSLGLLTSCAYSRTEMKVDYSPNIRAVSLFSPSSKSIIIAQVKDERGVSDPALIFQKSNAYGKTTGYYAADKPLAEIINTGLIKGLESSNYRLAPDNANYVLLATLQDLAADKIQGAWSGGTLKTKMTIRFEVIDKSSGKGIWRDTLIGRSSIECGWCVPYFNQAVTLTTDDVISRLLDNQAFQDIFR